MAEQEGLEGLEGLEVVGLTVVDDSQIGVDEETILPPEEMVLDADLLDAINDTSGAEFVDPTEAAMDTTMGELAE